MKKTIIVTGANTGIGKATAIGLAKKGNHIVLACRDKTKGENAKTEITRKTENKDVDFLLLDLSSKESIDDFVKNVNKKYSKIDVLINNAGVSLQEYKETCDGIEWTFAVNHLGPFILTNKLLDLLKKSVPSRIITVSSGVHTQAKLDLKDFNLRSNWNGYRAYANSKLCNIYFTYKLAEKLIGTGVTANCLAPGLVNSDFFRNYKKLPLIFKIVKKLIGKTPEAGAQTSIYLALSKDVENVNGKYFENCKPKVTSKISYNRDIAKELWDISSGLAV